jgi:hypothetical protein
MCEPAEIIAAGFDLPNTQHPHILLGDRKTASNFSEHINALCVMLRLIDNPHNISLGINIVVHILSAATGNRKHCKQNSEKEIANCEPCHFCRSFFEE